MSTSTSTSPSTSTVLVLYLYSSVGDEVKISHEYKFETGISVSVCFNFAHQYFFSYFGMCIQSRVRQCCILVLNLGVKNSKQHIQAKLHNNGLPAGVSLRDR